MNSMSYDLSKLPLNSPAAVLLPISDAASTLVRLDERIARSPLGQGFVKRSHFADACASLRIDGELVHLEDLVLRNASADIRTPTHELAIAHDVLKARRRIAAHPPHWALGADGLRSLRRQESEDVAAATSGEGISVRQPALAATVGAGEGEAATSETDDPLAANFPEIDALLVRSEAAIAEAKAPGRSHNRDQESLVYDLAWNEEERLAEYRTVLGETDGLGAAGDRRPR